MKTRYILFLALLFLARPAWAQQTADDAWSVIETMQRDAMQRAWKQLSERSMMRLVRTSSQEAAASHRVRYEAGRGTIVESDSSSRIGANSALARFADPDPLALPEASAVLFSDDPPFLSARNREAYDYRLASDTLWLGHRTRHVTVRARPETGARQSIRAVDLYVDAETDQLVGFYIVRADRAWLLDERSRHFVRLRPVGSAWQPYLLDVSVQTKLPLQAERRARTTSVFYDYIEAE